MSTGALDVLDVLNKLRDEAEQAAAAVASQTEKNKVLQQTIQGLSQEKSGHSAVIQDLQTKRIKLASLLVDKQERLDQAQAALAIKTAAAQHKLAAQEGANRALQVRVAKFTASCEAFRINSQGRAEHIRQLRLQIGHRLTELDLAQRGLESAQGILDSKRAELGKEQGEVRAEQVAREEKSQQLQAIHRSNRELEQELAAVEEEARQAEAVLEETRACFSTLRQQNLVMQNELRNLARRDSGPQRAGTATAQDAARPRSAPRGPSLELQTQPSAHSSVSPGITYSYTDSSALGHKSRGRTNPAVSGPGSTNVAKQDRYRVDVRAPFVKASSASAMQTGQNRYNGPGGRGVDHLGGGAQGHGSLTNPYTRPGTPSHHNPSPRPHPAGPPDLEL